MVSKYMHPLKYLLLSTRKKWKSFAYAPNVEVTFSNGYDVSSIGDPSS